MRDAFASRPWRAAAPWSCNGCCKGSIFYLRIFQDDALALRQRLRRHALHGFLSPTAIGSICVIAMLAWTVKMSLKVLTCTPKRRHWLLKVPHIVTYRMAAAAGQVAAAGETTALDTDFVHKLVGEWEENKAARENFDSYLCARGIGWIKRKLASVFSLSQRISMTETELLIRTQTGPWVITTGFVSHDISVSRFLLLRTY